MMSLSEVLGVVVGLMVAGYVYLTWTFDYWRKRGVAHMRPTAVVGNFGPWAFLRADVGTMFKQIYEATREHAAVGVWVFRRPAVVVNSPELIKHVLVKDFAHFADRTTYTDRTHDPLGSDNLFFGRNPHWKVMRAKLTHLFSSAKMKVMFQLMNEVGEDLEKSIAAKQGQSMELKDLSARFTTDVIATTAYGLKANTLLDETAPFNIFRKRLLDFRFFRSIQFMSIFFMQTFAKFAKCKVFEDDSANWMRNVFWRTVKERETTKEVRGDLISALIALRDETKNDNEIQFSGDSLVAQAAIFFTAGNESSSTTMSFLLYELALHPEIQEKLAKEIIETLAKRNNEIDYEILQDLPYLEACYKETLRKYPPLPFLDRECTEQYKMPGTNIVVEKGTYVYIPMMGLQHDPEYFPDPLTFDPERFYKENAQNVKPFTFFPFGEGPRICIGKRFGGMQSRIGMIHIIKRFVVRTCSKTKIPLTWQTLSLSPTTKCGIYLEFVERNNVENR